MATSSIFSNIHITDEASCRAFLDAVEASEKAAKNQVRVPIKIRELTAEEEIAAVFRKDEK
ncbi:MAG: hypothetical protein LBR44_04680 [Clostridiales Family XIII bacterium]|jgi:hypothetical protein|nr:hypothetical protein [Clostridiales Family XIII bacterium]